MISQVLFIAKSSHVLSPFGRLILGTGLGCGSFDIVQEYLSQSMIRSKKDLDGSRNNKVSGC